MTTREQLDQINEAIKAIELGAQEYRIGSRQIRKADLSVLYKERRELEYKLANEESGGIYVARFDTR